MRGRPGRVCGYVQRRAISSRCQRSSVAGVTKNADQRVRGSSRDNAASITGRRVQGRAVDLATQHRDLMAQHQQFDVLGPAVAGELGQHLQHQLLSPTGGRAGRRTGSGDLADVVGRPERRHTYPPGGAGGGCRADPRQAAGDRGGPVGIVAGYNQHRVLIVPACRQQFRPQIFGNFGLVIA
jgi:hypothetical protein